MSILTRHLVTEETQSSDAATYRKKLPSKGKLHSLQIKVLCTNGATSGRNVSILDVIDEVRVISERQDPIFKLSSQELEKWAETDLGKPLDIIQNAAASAVQSGVFTVMFGRGLVDFEKYLPLDRFGEVWLEIDFSPSIAADGGFATGTTKIDVIALVTPHEEPLPYKGTLVTRRLYEHTTVASGEKVFELPNSAIIRRIGAYCYETAVADDTDVTAIRLEEVGSGQKLVDLGWDDLIYLNQQLYGGIMQRSFQDLCLDNDTLLTRIGTILSHQIDVTVAPNNTTDVFTVAVVDAITGDQLTFAISTATIDAGSEVLATLATDAKYLVTVTGLFPTYFGFLPFNYIDVEDRYLNTGVDKDHQVVITQAAAGGTFRLAIQELKKF